MRSLLILVALTSIAHADARQDIVDIRHRRMPNHTDVLGWTDEGAFVLRRTTCEVQDLSEIPSCGVSIDVASTNGTVCHGLFGATWAIDCVEKDKPDPTLGCFKIPTADAMKFIATERDVLATLGPLHAGTKIDPTLATGTIKVAQYVDAAGERRRAALVFSTAGRWRPLHVLWSIRTEDDEFLRAPPSIDHIERSPDGTSLAVITKLSHAALDFYWESLDVTVIPAP